MSFLAAVIPGLREFRSPFSAGILWLVALGLVLYPQKDALTDSAKGQDLADAIGGLPQPTLIAGAAFAAYILGIIGTALTQRLRQAYNRFPTAWVDTSRWLPHYFSWVFRTIIKKRAQLSKPFIHQSDRAAGLLDQHIDDNLAHLSREIVSNGKPALRMMVNDDNELVAFRLSKDAPEQFQQYDKTLAEGQFRGAVALPMLIVSIALSFYLSGNWPVVVIVFGALAFLVLEARSATDYRRAAELLATTVYLKYTSPPSLDKLETRMKEQLLGSERPPGQDTAWLLLYFEDERQPKYRNALAEAIRHPSRAFGVREAINKIDDPFKRALMLTVVFGDRFPPELLPPDVLEKH